MTTVDDNLLAAKLRSAKSGAKAAARHLDMDAAKQRSAFENAFADAGKKKPTIAIDGKTTTADTTPRANIAIAQKLTAGAVSTTTASSAAIDIKSGTQTHAKVEIETKDKAEAKADVSLDAKAEAKVEAEVEAKFEAETKAEVRNEARAEARAKVEERLAADAEANIDAGATQTPETLSASATDGIAMASFDDAPIDVKSIYSDSAKTPEKPTQKIASEELPVSQANKAAAKDEPVAVAPSTVSNNSPSSDLSTSSVLSTLITLTSVVEPKPDAEAMPVDDLKPEPKLKASGDVLQPQAQALPKQEPARQELSPASAHQSGAETFITVTQKADAPAIQNITEQVGKPPVMPEKVTEAKPGTIKTEASRTVESKAVETKTVEVKESGVKTQEVKTLDLKPAQPDPAPQQQSTDDAASVVTVPAAPGTTTTATDVSHLLTLLSAEPQAVADTTAVKVEATPALSEFHALADRAGLAATANRDRAETKSETKSDATPASDKVATGSEKAAASPDAGAAIKTVSADTDQIFRFARSDGKGQTVSMNMVSDVDKVAAKNDIPAVASTKAEAVTVVEARRYLGLAPSSNAAAVTSQIVSNPEWAKTLQPTTEASTHLTQASTAKVLNTLKIQMHPIDLGMVTATLRLKEDELHVELKVETGEAFRQLSDDQSDMVKSLRSQGFAVDQVSIIFNAPDSSGGTTQQQGQPQTGQQCREASADGSTQGRGQRNDNGGQQQSSGRWTGNEGTSDPSSGADASRTGDVYI